MIRHLHLREFVGEGQSFHLAAPATITSSKPESHHDHDFFEVFYVESGVGWHLINDQRHALMPGLLALVRDSDAHALTADGKDLKIVNVAFSKRHWKATLSRCFPNLADPMKSPVEQRSRAIGSANLRHLGELSTRMSRAGRTQAYLEHFLVEVLWIWSEVGGTPADGSPMPDWLAMAITELAKQEHLKQGTRGLAELAGRTPDHVARAARRWLGQSPTELVTAARMQHAARLLAETDRSILDIADECGLPNLAYFYKRFAERFGCTPRNYRLQQFRITGHLAHRPPTTAAASIRQPPAR